MRLWDKRSTRDVMVGSVWLSAIMCVPLIRYMTLPPMPWREAIEYCVFLCAFITPVMAVLGSMTDRLNIRRKYGYDVSWRDARFLEKCEEDMEKFSVQK